MEKQFQINHKDYPGIGPYFRMATTELEARQIIVRESSIPGSEPLEDGFDINDLIAVEVA